MFAANYITAIDPATYKAQRMVHRKRLRTYRHKEI
jgi:hypothetical protein